MAHTRQQNIDLHTAPNRSKKRSRMTDEIAPNEGPSNTPDAAPTNHRSSKRFKDSSKHKAVAKLAAELGFLNISPTVPTLRVRGKESGTRGTAQKSTMYKPSEDSFDGSDADDELSKHHPDGGALVAGPRRPVPRSGPSEERPSREGLMGTERIGYPVGEESESMHRALPFRLRDPSKVPVVDESAKQGQKEYGRLEGKLVEEPVDYKSEESDDEMPMYSNGKLILKKEEGKAVGKKGRTRRKREQ